MNKDRRKTILLKAGLTEDNGEFYLKDRSKFYNAVWKYLTYTYSTNKAEDLGFFIVFPGSKFYFHWFLILSVAIGYNAFYIPYSLVFEYHVNSGKMLGIDLVMMIIYFLDIIIHARTAIKRE
jgi:hypothetical protein